MRECCSTLTCSRGNSLACTNIYTYMRQALYARASYFTRHRRRLGLSYQFRARHTRDYFTHRLCDKNRDSANLLIRLFFRPSNIADAAISIFNRYLRDKKRIQSIRCALRSANSIGSITRRRGYPAGNDRSLSRMHRPRSRFISQWRRTRRASCRSFGSSSIYPVS